MQSASPQDHFFSLATLIEYFSQYYEFQPGDVVTMSAEGIGTMRNPVVGP